MSGRYCRCRPRTRFAASFTRVRRRCAHANSLASIARPATIASHPGPGSASMATPAASRTKPTTVLAARTSRFTAGSHTRCANHAQKSVRRHSVSVMPSSPSAFWMLAATSRTDCVPAGFASVGKPAFCHASKPPCSGRTFVQPRVVRACATRALECSCGHVQYGTMRPRFGISSRCASTSSGGMRIDFGI